MNVLSLFDGISCGQIALERAGVHVDHYFSSEIDKHSINVTQVNHPQTIQIGNVKTLRGDNLPQIGLLMGGSPCKSFSVAGKRLNFDDPNGKLFFEYLRMLEETKPKYFFFENVLMQDHVEAAITAYFGVEPIFVNSEVVSAQSRRRMYWTNIEGFKMPQDRGIELSDILDEDIGQFPPNVSGMQLNKATILGRRLDSRGKRQDYNKDIPISQCLEVRASKTNKSNCLTTVAKDNVLTPLPIGRYPNAFKDKLPFRYYTVAEMCRLQTLPIDYFTGVSSPSRSGKLIGNGWTVDVIVEFFKLMT
tara:strand:- start:6506 stop:7417 length:912 start_codon:yes stop_codon:yes gene_type:complete